MATTNNPDPGAAAPSPGYTPPPESPIQSHDSWRLDPENLVKDKVKHKTLAILLSWKTPVIVLLSLLVLTAIWHEIDKRASFTKRATWYAKRPSAAAAKSEGPVPRASWRIWWDNWWDSSTPAKPKATPVTPKPSESPKVASMPPSSPPPTPTVSEPSPTETPSASPEPLPPPGKSTGRAIVRLLPNKRSRGIAATSYEQFEFTLDAGVLWKLEEKATETPESRAREFTVLEWADGTAHGTWLWHISEDGKRTIGGRFLNLRLVRPNLYRGDLYEEKSGRVVNEATHEIELKP